MAREKKKEKELTIEERLEQALVPVEEQPYKVPENWCWVYWGKCGQFIAGSAFKNSYQGFKEYNIPFYKVGSLKYIDADNYLYDFTNTINEELREKLKASLIPINSILFAKIGEAIRLNRRALNIVPCCIDNNMMAFVPQKCNFKYVLYWSMGVDLYNFTNATTVPAIRKSDLENMAFPLPPFTEQQRIVDRIESLFAKLDETREKAQAVVDGFETRKAAILHKAFTGKLTRRWRIEYDASDDETWEIKLLGEITSNYDSKRIPLSQEERNSLTHLYDYYGASGIIDQVDRYIFEGRYLLIGEDGANLVIRSKPIAFIADGRFWVNNHAHVLKASGEVSLDYLCYYINSIDLTPYITGSAQPKMTQVKMNGIPIPVPTISEQAEIVCILDSLLDKEQQVKKSAVTVLDQIETMKKSILARAFRGELGTNDPKEESAVELLKRVL